MQTEAQETTANRHTGYIRKIVPGKVFKYGFIAPHDGSCEGVFVSERSVEPKTMFTVGRIVEYTRIQTPKGAEAVEIKVIA